MRKIKTKEEHEKVIDAQEYLDYIKKLICARIKTKVGSFRHTHLIKEWKKTVREYKIRGTV